MIECPKCGSKCEGEAMREKAPWYLNCECECGLEFAYDTYQDECYDLDGNLINKE